MGGFVIKVEGLEKTLNRFDLNKSKYFDKVQQLMYNSGINIQREAKQLAPTDEGLLKNSIFYEVNKLKITVGCSVNYAAFVEFGIRKYAAEYVATLPIEWQQLASRAKGSGGGTFDELVLRIFGWVKRKGLRLQPKVTEQADVFSFGKLRKNKKKPKRITIERGQEQLAYLIAVKIVREGVKPQPFLYPAVTNEMPKLISKIDEINL